MRVGSVTDGVVTFTALARAGQWFPLDVGAGSVLDVLVAGNADGAAPQALAASFRPAVPFRPPRNLLCLGKNFRAHAEEFAAYSADRETVPERPIVFTKAPEALCGAGDPIAVGRDLAQALDYEVELGVVIGRAGAAISRADAPSHVAGYTIVNDVTARDVQERHRQWFLGKSLPAASPIGPVIVTPDELPDLDQTKISCHVNGELRQSAVLGDMIVGIDEAIEVISAIVPLELGDIVSMGTPSGVGIGFTPPRFLSDGDEIVCAIDGIGELRNVVTLVDRGAP